MRAVVRGQDPELGNGVDGRHNVETSRAAPVGVFAAIRHPEVVVLAQAVKADARVATDRGRALEIRHVGRGSRRQAGQRVQAAAVGSKLRYLLRGDDVANLAAIRLYGKRRGLDIHALLRAANLQLEIRAGAVPNVQLDVFLLGHLEARGFGTNRVMANGQVRSHILAKARGLDVANLTGFDACDRDFDVRNRGPGGVRDCSDNRCFLG